MRIMCGGFMPNAFAITPPVTPLRARYLMQWLKTWFIGLLRFLLVIDHYKNRIAVEKAKSSLLRMG
jgi:hypothetical protein